MRELTLAEIDVLLKEGIAYCQSVGRPSSIGVVDMGGTCVARCARRRAAATRCAWSERSSPRRHQEDGRTCTRCSSRRTAPS